ncbi:MAG: TetR/AcrR family transcriptional regulator C-terminal domain-containing protein [Bacilli bacterium]|nr:TetR/AcrR family transcriptional regulator C-terminal domain-containing protein [Bacilli bacterium]
MNIVNNKRKKDSQTKIQRAFVELIQFKTINEITISDICQKANLNRSTFYSNYLDIYDLADKIRDELFQDVLALYPEETKEKKHSYDFLRLFRHIKENQLFYKTYFKLNYDNDTDFFKEMIDDSEFERFYKNKDHLKYHITFFRHGLNAIIESWLYNGCQESPEEIEEIIKEEYQIKKYI